MQSGISVEKMKAAAESRILVVDDDAAVAECMVLFLQSAGYPVDAVTDSNEALGRIIASPDKYEVLVSDNSMPHLGGRELIDQARKAGFKGKVIVYSGSVSPDEELEFKSLGADVVLRKPFDFKLIVPTVVDLCGHDGGAGKPPA